MEARDGYYGHLTSLETSQAARENSLIVLPLGAIEQHGPHLPIDVDSYLAARAAREAVELARSRHQANVFYLPGVHYGNSFSHMEFPGRISLSFDTFIAVIYDILDELAKTGFRKFVIFNGNGGNEVCITVAVRKLTEKWRSQNIYLRIYKLGIGDLSSPPMPQGFADKINSMIPGNDGEIHAGARETSYYLANLEELVRKDRNVKPETKKVSWINLTLDQITNTGSTGDPTKASKEMGIYFWDTVIPVLADYLAELSSTD